MVFGAAGLYLTVIVTFFEFTMLTIVSIIYLSINLFINQIYIMMNKININFLSVFNFTIRHYVHSKLSIYGLHSKAKIQ